jgi:hypothetical protein
VHQLAWCDHDAGRGLAHHSPRPQEASPQGHKLVRRTQSERAAQSVTSPWWPDLGKVFIMCFHDQRCTGLARRWANSLWLGTVMREADLTDSETTRWSSGEEGAALVAQRGLLG